MCPVNNGPDVLNDRMKTFRCRGGETTEAFQAGLAAVKALQDYVFQFCVYGFCVLAKSNVHEVAMGDQGP